MTPYAGVTEPSFCSTSLSLKIEPATGAAMKSLCIGIFG